MNFIKNIVLLVMVVTKVKADDPPAPDLFANLDTKEVPFYICKASGNSIKWTFPSHLPCDPVDTTLPTSLVNITLWFEDTSSYTIPVAECYSEMTYTRLTVNWNFEIVKTTWSEASKMSTKTCSQIIDQFEGNKLQKLKPNLYGTSKPCKPSLKYMACTSSFVTNYYLSVLQATVENDKWAVETSSNFYKPCPFMWGKCKSKRGILVWDNDLKMCTLRKGISTTCMVTGSRITCIEDSLSLNIVDEVKRCGMKIGFTEEGIFFTQDNVYGENGVNLGTTPTSTVAKQIPGNIYEESKPSRNSDQFFLTYPVVEGNSSIYIQSQQDWCCERNRFWYDSILMIVQFGLSTQDFFELLNGEKDDTYLSTLDGRLLSIYKCTKIHEYQMLPRESNECIKEWPIAYLHENVRKTGYMVGISHEIVDIPTEKECTLLEFYFKYGEYWYLLNDNTVVAHPNQPLIIKGRPVKSLWELL